MPSLTFEEKNLYHQIHPLKLVVDILATPPALYLFWQHEWLPALAVTFVPSVIASAAIIQWVDLTPQKNSAFGRYLWLYMSPLLQALRLAGLSVMVLGAWLHNWLLIALGLALVLLCWLRGLLWPKRG